MQKTNARFLVVEDEALVSLLIEDMLVELGHDVVAAVATVEQALRRVAAEDFDAAILDVNLAGTPSYAIADALGAKGVPFVFSTGYGARGLRPDFKDRPVLQKPFQMQELKRALEGLWDARQSSGEV